jgi:predicted NUDIX family NTP pyrophosphohydrolase
MPKLSAGIVLFRKPGPDLEIFLVHPGGPFWTNKDLGAWSFPKGEYSDDEEPLTVAKREFLEETGSTVDGELIPLTPVRQKGGKIVSLWAVEGDIDPETIRSNTFEMEWPPRSGKKAEFPEVDRARWYSVSEARRKLNAGQVPALDELCERVVRQEPLD